MGCCGSQPHPPKFDLDLSIYGFRPLVLSGRVPKRIRRPPPGPEAVEFKHVPTPAVEFFHDQLDVLLRACPSAPVQGTQAYERLRRGWHATCSLKVTTTNNKQQYGSGFLFQNGSQLVLVTHRQVVSSSLFIMATFKTPLGIRHGVLFRDPLPVGENWCSMQISDEMENDLRLNGIFPIIPTQPPDLRKIGPLPPILVAICATYIGDNTELGSFLIVPQFPLLDSLITSHPELWKTHSHYTEWSGSLVGSIGQYRGPMQGKSAYFLHDVNTYKGSIGAPLLDMNGHLIGLHQETHLALYNN